MDERTRLNFTPLLDFPYTSCAKNVLFLQNEANTQRYVQKAEIRFGDLYQSASRTPTSSDIETMHFYFIILLRLSLSLTASLMMFEVNYEVSTYSGLIYVANFKLQVSSSQDVTTEELPTLLPSAKIWDLKESRLILGRVEPDRHSLQFTV